MSSSKILSFAHLISPQVHRRKCHRLPKSALQSELSSRAFSWDFLFIYLFISYGLFFLLHLFKKKKKKTFGRSHIGYKEFKVTKSTFVWSRSCKQPQVQKSTAPPILASITLCNNGNQDFHAHLSCKLGWPKGRDAVICSSGSLTWSYCGMTGGLSHVLIFTDLGRDALFL